jgi:2'-5' RNA ligase
MPFAIVLLMNNKANRKVKIIHQLLDKNGIPAPLFSPHVSLAGFEKGDVKGITHTIKKIGMLFNSFSFQFMGIGSFPTEKVLYLSPVVTERLLQLHSRVHRVLKNVAEGFSPYYLPGGWVPHCTLCITPSSSKLLKSFKVVQKVFNTISGRFNNLELLEYRPVPGDVYDAPVRKIFSFPLRNLRR